MGIITPLLTSNYPWTSKYAFVSMGARFGFRYRKAGLKCAQKFAGSSGNTVCFPTRRTSYGKPQFKSQIPSRCMCVCVYIYIYKHSNNHPKPNSNRGLGFVLAAVAAGWLGDRTFELGQAL